MTCCEKADSDWVSFIIDDKRMLVARAQQQTTTWLPEGSVCFFEFVASGRPETRMPIKPTSRASKKSGSGVRRKVCVCMCVYVFTWVRLSVWLLLVRIHQPFPLIMASSPPLLLLLSALSLHYPAYLMTALSLLGACKHGSRTIGQGGGVTLSPLAEGQSGMGGKRRRRWLVTIGLQEDDCPRERVHTDTHMHPQDMLKIPTDTEHKHTETHGTPSNSKHKGFTPT